MKFETQTHYQRFMLGIICGLLPVACLLFGLFGELRGINSPGWYNSISATFFCNSGSLMVIALGLCAFFLFSYQGYVDSKKAEKRTIKNLFRLTDRKLTLIAAAAALGVVFFPCNTEAAGSFVGLFAVPVGLSNILHSVSAAALFGSFALMTLTQFTKGGHKKRNTIYRICGWTMLAFMAVVGLAAIFDWPGYMTMICETGMLWAFSVAWIIKSGVFQKI